MAGVFNGMSIKTGRIVVCLAMMLALILVSGCSGQSRPFSKSSGPAARSAPTVSITAVNGMPAPKVTMLAGFMQEAGAKNDLAIINQDFTDSWKLAGNFVPQVQPDGTTNLVYAWTLRDSKGQVVHQINAAQSIGHAGSAPWTAVSRDALRIIATSTADNLASRMGQLGYATQQAGLTPPSDTFAKAGPNAEKELDYETLYGTLSAQPPVGQQVAAVTPPPAAQPVTASKDAPAPAKAGKPAKAANPNAQAIRGVTITGVKGSPGKGNAELANAMRRVIKKAGWPVFASPRPDALNISGKVDLGKKTGSTQKVALAWTVTTPGGKSLGTVRQANSVAAGSLDAGWGQTAEYAAQAGAEGIFNLVGKLR